MLGLRLREPRRGVVAAMAEAAAAALSPCIVIAGEVLIGSRKCAPWGSRRVRRAGIPGRQSARGDQRRGACLDRSTGGPVLELVTRHTLLQLGRVSEPLRMTSMTATEQTFDSPVAAPADGIILTDEAAAKVKALLEGEGREDLALRVAVQPGGCSGLRYQLFFDERSFEGDIVKAFGGVDVVTDRMSAPYLMGATIDFVDTIEKQGFTIDNPNATGSCACGDSFH